MNAHRSLITQARQAVHAVFARGHAAIGAQRLRGILRGKSLLFSAAVLGFSSLQGCSAFHPVRGVPASYIPCEYLGTSREGARTINLGRLVRNKTEHRVEAGDVLSIYLPGVLGGLNSHAIDPIGEIPPINLPNGNEDPPTVGFPIQVRGDHTISLPQAEPINVYGMTLHEVEQTIRRTYVGVLKQDQIRVMVSLQRPREYRVLVVRQEVADSQRNGGGGGMAGTSVNLGSSKKGTAKYVRLRAYENDVMTALCKADGGADGLPGLDAENTIYVFRRNQNRTAPVDKPVTFPAVRPLDRFEPTVAPPRSGEPIFPDSTRYTPNRFDGAPRERAAYVDQPAPYPADYQYSSGPMSMGSWGGSSTSPDAALPRGGDGLPLTSAAGTYTPALRDRPPVSRDRLDRSQGLFSIPEVDDTPAPYRNYRQGGHSVSGVQTADYYGAPKSGVVLAQQESAAMAPPTRTGHSPFSNYRAGGPLPTIQPAPRPIPQPASAAPAQGRPARQAGFVEDGPPLVEQSPTSSQGHPANDWAMPDLNHLASTIDDPNVVRIPVRLTEGETLNLTEEDVTLYDGDIVFIESRNSEVFYTGGLLGGGQYTLPRDYDLHVLDAVSIATTSGRGQSTGARQSSGGVSALNQDVSISGSRLLILRTLADRRQVRIEVDLYKAMRYPEENIRVQPGDHLFLQYTCLEATGAFVERHVMEGALIGIGTTLFTTGRR